MALNKTDVSLIADVMRALKPSKKNELDKYKRWLKQRDIVIVGIIPYKYKDFFTEHCSE